MMKIQIPMDKDKGGKTMIYKDFQDLKLSALGMGAMRLPVMDGDDCKRNGCLRYGTGRKLL